MKKAFVLVILAILFAVSGCAAEADTFCSIKDESGGVSADIRDFINPELARSLTEQLDAEILPLLKG